MNLIVMSPAAPAEAPMRMTEAGRCCLKFPRQAHYRVRLSLPLDQFALREPREVRLNDVEDSHAQATHRRTRFLPDFLTGRFFVCCAIR